MTSEHWINSGTQGEDPMRAYGTTGGNNSPSSKPRNHDDVDIQLHDFKVGVNFKEPLINDSNPYGPSVERKPAVRPTSLNALLHSPSSDQNSGFSDTSFTQHDSWIRHPKVRENWRIVLASALLSILGIALILTGIGIAFTSSRGYHCLIFGVIGLLCVIPGGYHFIYIYCAALGKPGYQFENLPVLR